MYWLCQSENLQFVVPKVVGDLRFYPKNNFLRNSLKSSKIPISKENVASESAVFSLHKLLQHSSKWPPQKRNMQYILTFYI